MRRYLLLIMVAGSLCAACGGGPDLTVNTPEGEKQVAIVAESFLTAWDQADNIDSPAVWHGPDGERWVITTAKEADVLVVYDAATGEIVGRHGGSGTGPGEFERPNGVAVVDDLAIVVERDNHRVQFLSLPSFEHRGFAGEDVLTLPYGIFICPESPGVWGMYITDDYEGESGGQPADSELGHRVRHFRVTIGTDRLETGLVNTFGDTSGEGALRVVESIWGDPAYNRLLIADEKARMLKIYTLDGTFTGQTLGDGIFEYDPEGIVLYDNGRGGGYWLTTDQDAGRTRFHVFERRSLEYAGSFAGRTVANTDGNALTTASFDGFPAGAFYAVHDDGGLGAFSMRAVADTLGLDL